MMPVETVFRLTIAELRFALLTEDIIEVEVRDAQRRRVYTCDYEARESVGPCLEAKGWQYPIHVYVSDQSGRKLKRKIEAMRQLTFADLFDASAPVQSA
jgi:hypothetical protein